MPDRDLIQEAEGKALSGPPPIKHYPKLTEEGINEEIADIQYHQFPGTLVTVCCVTMKNGFSSVGQSTPASIAQFNQAVGRENALIDAKRKIWEFEAYVLKSKLHEDCYVPLRRYR